MNISWLPPGVGSPADGRAGAAVTHRRRGGWIVAMMLLVMLFHVTRREWPNIGPNVVLGALAFAVAYRRW